MAEILKLWVSGIPCGKPRATFRCVPQRTKGGAKVYVPVAYHDRDINADCDLWQKRVREAVASVMRMPEKPLAEPLRVDIDFYFPRPEYLLKASAPSGRIFYDQKPDRDNSDKAVLDALATVWKTTKVGPDGKPKEVQVGIYDDDKRVCQGEPQKWYPEKGKPTGAWIVVQTLTEAEAEPVLFDTTGTVPKIEGFKQVEEARPKLVHPATLLPALVVAKIEATRRPEGRPRQFRCGNCDSYFMADKRPKVCPNCDVAICVRELRPGTFDGLPLAEAPAPVLTDWAGEPIRRET